MSVYNTLITSKLTKVYSGFTALHPTELEIKTGSVHGLLGPNGAGKTTLIRLIMGMIRPSSGSAKILNSDCYHESAQVHEKVGYLPGETRLFRRMRGKQVLDFLSSMHPRGSYQKAISIADRLGVDLERKVADCSSGMRQKISLAAVLSLQCQFIILDEPTTHLDPTARKIVIDLVKESQAQDKTILFSSHVFEEVEEACDQVTILKSGKIVYENSIGDIVSNHQVTGIVDSDSSLKTTSELTGLIPTEIREQILEFEIVDNHVHLKVQSNLANVLSFLQSLNLKNMTINQTGLKQVYEHYSMEQAS